MKITELMNDQAILEEFGQRLSQRRLDLQMTQAMVAKEAGVSKSTVERLEAGAATQTSNLVRIFRVLGLLGDLDRMLPERGPSPMEILKLKGKRRKRASSQRMPDRRDETWSWGDEE